MLVEMEDLGREGKKRGGKEGRSCGDDNGSSWNDELLRIRKLNDRSM